MHQIKSCYWPVSGVQLIGLWYQPAGYDQKENTRCVFRKGDHVWRGSRERLTAFVPTSDCRFNCHGMIYVTVGKLIVTNLQLLAPLVPLFLSPAKGAIFAPPPPPPPPPAPPGHHATAATKPIPEGRLRKPTTPFLIIRRLAKGIGCDNAVNERFRTKLVVTLPK